MALLFSEIDHSDWLNLVEKNNIDDIFYQTNYHAIITKHYNCDCNYYSIQDGSEHIIALPIFHKGKDASLVTHFFYHAIFFNSTLSERKKIEAFDLLANSLIKSFDKLDFKLEPNCNDVRAFVWNGYDTKTYYSYHLDLNQELIYSENINRQIKKYDKNHKVEKLENFELKIIDAQIRDMVKNGLGSAEGNKVRNWMKDFYDKGLLDVFILKDDQEQEQGSAIYIKDKNSAYLIAVMSNNSSQALLYDKVFKHYKSANIMHIDLLGANIQNVAIYKSQFDVKLISYHIVTYRKNKVWESIKKAIKLKIKSIYK